MGRKRENVFANILKRAISLQDQLQIHISLSYQVQRPIQKTVQ